MAREAKMVCRRCDARLGAGPYCPKCGYPTPNATHEDRVEWELRQWGAPNAAALVASTPMKQRASVVAETRSRRWFKSRSTSNGASKPQANGKPAENGNGHKTAEEVVEVSPFAPPAPEVKKASVKTPRTNPASKQDKATPAKATPAKATPTKKPAKSQATAPKKSTPAKVTAPKPSAKAAKPKAEPRKAEVQKVEAPKLEAPKVEAPKVEPKPNSEMPKVSSIRAARRLPSLADVEDIAKKGPPIVKILRLIQMRVALMEAEMANGDVAKTG